MHASTLSHYRHTYQIDVQTCQDSTQKQKQSDAHHPKRSTTVPCTVSNDLLDTNTGKIHQVKCYSKSWTSKSFEYQKSCFLKSQSDIHWVGSSYRPTVSRTSPQKCHAQTRKRQKSRHKKKLSSAGLPNEESMSWISLYCAYRSWMNVLVYRADMHVCTWGEPCHETIQGGVRCL